MAVGPVQRAKRAFVLVLLELARVYCLAIAVILRLPLTQISVDKLPRISFLILLIPLRNASTNGVDKLVKMHSRKIKKCSTKSFDEISFLQNASTKCFDEICRRPTSHPMPHLGFNKTCWNLDFASGLWQNRVRFFCWKISLKDFVERFRRKIISSKYFVEAIRRKIFRRIDLLNFYVFFVGALRETTSWASAGALKTSKIKNFDFANVVFRIQRDGFNETYESELLGSGSKVNFSSRVKPPTTFHSS